MPSYGRAFFVHYLRKVCWCLLLWKEFFCAFSWGKSFCVLSPGESPFVYLLLVGCHLVIKTFSVPSLREGIFVCLLLGKAFFVPYLGGYFFVPSLKESLFVPSALKRFLCL